MFQFFLVLCSHVRIWALSAVMAKETPCYARHPSLFPLSVCLRLEFLKDKCPVSLSQRPPHLERTDVTICLWFLNDFLASVTCLSRQPKTDLDYLDHLTWQNGPLSACLSGYLRSSSAFHLHKSFPHPLLMAISSLIQKLLSYWQLTNKYFNYN